MGSSSDVATAIREVRQRFMDTFADGEAAAVAACFAEDARLLPPNIEALHGRTAIAGRIGYIRDLGAKHFELESAELEGVGDAAWEVGQYVAKLADGTVIDRGKYMVIWKQSGGSWCLHRMMTNTDLALPP
jgi:ketosteroid isomerase-like protein